jgi:hypothetical protein
MRASRPRPANAGVSGAWISLGPLPLPSDASGIGLQDYGWVSGRATAVVIDPNDSSGNTVFAGGAYAGIWKSINAGSQNPTPALVTWTPLTDDQLTLAIGAIAVQPQLLNPDPNQSVVLAGTGETNSSADSYYGLGILRSIDGGRTWSPIISQDTQGHSFAGLGFSQIAFSSANANLVVAATASASEGILEGLENPVGANRGLYYSLDAGSTWQATNVRDNGIVISPSSVTSVSYNAAASAFFAVIRFHGIYSSPDGINWTRLPIQPGSAQPGSPLDPSVCPPQTVLPSNCPIYRGEIAVVPQRGGSSGRGEMYVWYVDANDFDQGIWQSLNGGTSWTKIDDSGITNCGDLFGGCGTAQGSYNLALAAVPDGSATDLYAGATNLYKCTITHAFPTCNGAGDNTFLNLTHAYGCSDIAKVHPDQHALDSLVSNGTALLYFANDGGIYRALDGFTGLRAGTCGMSNQFDNLNQTLGPMTQFVSVSQSSSNPNLLFGGTQDNGAPATAFSQSTGNWVNVNAGDDGFTAVNPANDSEWFVAMPPDSISGVNLFRCVNGVNCHSQDFQNGQIADSNQVGGDTGAFYLPFVLDPQNTASIILGTCRVWRGPSTGGSFSALSPNFETGFGACSGGEVNLVRSLAAGGVVDPNGNSQVIYAGTNGEGPLIPGTPTGGHVWVTTNALAGPSAWVDRTGPINPQGFPISAIALDSADPTGNTAYVTIMGFHTPHVWKTTNAGLSWADFSGGIPSVLPDAPVNAVVVDSGSSLSNGNVYVGTDVGVFASSTGSPAWTEVGPSLGGGPVGFLPNVAVTSLQIFNAGSLHRLRAATYGRGIWEWNLSTVPDYQIVISNNPQTILAGQTATFSGAIYTLNSYNSSVNLSCTAGATLPPQNCNAPAVLPTSVGATFSVVAGGSIGDYAFNLHAVGMDLAAVTHDFALTLHITDFTLSAPSPSGVSVLPGNTSAPVSMTVSALGSFAGSVTLSCSGLPSGAACQFQPSTSILPTAASPVSLLLNISTSANTPVGSFPITISASTPGEPAKTQTVTLTVGAAPDYDLAIAIPSLTTSVNTSAVYHGTLTAINGYNSAVSLTCGSGAPPTCVASPASAVPSVAGLPFTVTVSSNISQAYSFNIVASGTDPSAIAHSTPVNFTSLPAQTFDFTMGLTPTSASVVAGHSTLFSLDVNPTTGTFPNSVSLSCSALPALTLCAFNPAQVGSGSGDSVISLTLSTTAPVSQKATAAFIAGTYFSALPLVSCLWLVRPAVRRKLWRIPMLALVFSLAIVCLSCGSGLQGNGGGSSGNPGTPPGTYNITVTATTGTITHSTTLALAVTP